MAGHIADAGNIHWCTSGKLLEPIREVIGGQIALDPCSNDYSIVNAQIEYKLPDKNGLNESWESSSCLINPPFGRYYMNDELDVKSVKEFKELRDKGTYKRYSIYDWVFKCVQSYQLIRHLFLLIPAAIETRHFHDFIYSTATAILYPKGRIGYLDEKGEEIGSPPMASVLIYWGEDVEKFNDVFSRLGHVEILKGS